MIREVQQFFLASGRTNLISTEVIAGLENAGMTVNHADATGALRILTAQHWLVREELTEDDRLMLGTRCKYFYRRNNGEASA